MDAVILALVEQHVREVVMLREMRTRLVRSPQVRIAQLAALDERIAAHLDGIVVAGPHGKAMCGEALAPPDTGSLFAAGVLMIEERDAEGLRRLFALAASLPAARRGLVSSFGWVSASRLRGITKALLDAAEPMYREFGLAACAMHRIDPGAALAESSANGRVAWRAAVALGRIDLAPALVDRLRTAGPDLAFDAARAALLLGEHDPALSALQELGTVLGTAAEPALELLVSAAPIAQARAVLKRMYDDPQRWPTLVRLIGLSGDPHFVPWLIARMDQPALARLAGESFCLIAGVDLVAGKLDRPAPQDLPEDADDAPSDIEQAELAWPDPAKVAAWWHEHGTRFTPGVRHLVGAPLSTTQGHAVLRNGSQPQRSLAAIHLCLLAPGTPLFNTAAPAWRQRRWLAALGT